MQTNAGISRDEWFIAIHVKPASSVAGLGYRQKRQGSSPTAAYQALNSRDIITRLKRPQ
jgi:hypothetical protein